ncbi:hypothetical protein KI387_032498, partial [Taxus chinensis]
APNAGLGVDGIRGKSRKPAEAEESGGQAGGTGRKDMAEGLRSLTPGHTRGIAWQRNNKKYVCGSSKSDAQETCCRGRKTRRTEQTQMES